MSYCDSPTRTAMIRHVYVTVIRMQASMEFKLPAQVKKKGKWFISSCNLLDVHSQGHTREQAERNLKDALATFLLSCYERGALEIVLREAGFVPAVGRPKSKTAARG